MMTRYAAIIFLVMTLLSCSEMVKISKDNGTEVILTTEEYLDIVVDAYIYGYPLVLMDLTKQVTTNTELPHPTRPLAPVNQLGHFRIFPDHTLTAVVKPNVDTYYSMSWLDLSHGPLVLHMPATDRYYLLPFYDAYSNVFSSPGTRTTGKEELNMVIARDTWEGDVPDDHLLISAPTDIVWLLGRIQVNSAEDGATTVRALQDSMWLRPLSETNNGEYQAPKGEYDPQKAQIIPVKDIEKMDIETYLNKVTELMVSNPPAALDNDIVNRMKTIGLNAGEKFQLNTDNFILSQKIKAIPRVVHEQFRKRKAQPDRSTMKNNWMMATEHIGKYDSLYKIRAYIDFIGYGANLPEDAVYPITTLDVNGAELNGSNKYFIHIPKHELPPVKAFWSLTAYNADEFLIQNEINRYALGDRDSLIYNEDGSLDIYIQHKKPEDSKVSNWLPTVEDGPFSLTMRLYWPDTSVLQGIWTPPAVVPVE